MLKTTLHWVQCFFFKRKMFFILSTINILQRKGWMKTCIRRSASHKVWNESFNSVTGKADIYTCISYDSITVSSAQTDAVFRGPFHFLRGDESLKNVLFLPWGVQFAFDQGHSVRETGRGILWHRCDEKINTWICAPHAAQVRYSGTRNTRNKFSVSAALKQWLQWSLWGHKPTFCSHK